MIELNLEFLKLLRGERRNAINFGIFVDKKTRGDVAQVSALSDETRYIIIHGTQEESEIALDILHDSPAISVTTIELLVEMRLMIDLSQK